MGFNFVIFPNQIYVFGNVVLVRRGNRKGMDQPISGVYANMTLHTEPSLIALSGLMHFRIASLLYIFC